MASVTGKIRRNPCPFLWDCTMGINDGSPDEDSLAKIFLFNDHINSVLCDINRSYSDTVLDDADIEQLQKIYLNLGQ